MKLELKMLESQDASVANIWKKKCLDLYDVCQSLKYENDELRTRCKELIDQGISLADAIGNMDHQEISALGSSKKYNNNANTNVPDSAGMGSHAARPFVSTSYTFNNHMQSNSAMRYHVGSSQMLQSAGFND
jgi:hypothetical protein